MNFQIPKQPEQLELYLPLPLLQIIFNRQVGTSENNAVNVFFLCFVRFFVMCNSLSHYPYGYTATHTLFCQPTGLRAAKVPSVVMFGLLDVRYRYTLVYVRQAVRAVCCRVRQYAM